jgi:alkanesulfonate monooxygenase SsuD/methylene tetrahydromethanopterin reductase-like flavin-dependent oxidoreductase (luciferase family)
MADEYMDVVYKLWESSWHDNAVKRDKESGIFTDPALVRPINHKGTYFKDVPGPVSQTTAPSPVRSSADPLPIAFSLSRTLRLSAPPRSTRLARPAQEPPSAPR